MTDEGKLWAILSYIFILWLVPLWVIKPRNDFAVYHAKQAFGLFLTAVVLGWLPFIGWLVSIFVLVLWVIGIVNAARGVMTPVPLLGPLFEQWFVGL